MSYICQDPDIFVPHKGKHVVSLTRRSWFEELAFEECGLSSNCWCGEQPGSCVDCTEDSVNIMMAKVNIGSGEDGDMFR